MLAIMKMSNKFYSREVDSFEYEELREYLEDMTSQGTPVTLVTEIEDACDLFGIDPTEIVEVIC